ncbi:MAG: tRNA (adenosine(37)-N6)-threonylcarbamoyltransferase complex dimerization subunit type 1 TsaB [Saprospiraceae bacterium]|nr:tRNA (adenosine(37)-N6)-threonylcarbamoyltransferase complex dimerization subunit type 1 TsaB [Saprospiraceae bacterium]
MAKILLIETATEVCSAAIAVDGQVVAIQEDLHAKNHAEVLTLFIDTCVRLSGISLSALDAIAVSSGPGSYTSLRVGASVAKGLCYALDKPLIAIDTLFALAHACRNTCTDPTGFWFAPSLDARRQEVWMAIYNDALEVQFPSQPLIIENNSFEKLCDSLGIYRVVLAGNGMKKIRSGEFEKKAVSLSEIICSANHLAGLAERFFYANDFQDVAYYEPFYMKPPNITTPNQSSF